MGKWMTASEISERFFIGEARLLSFSKRGNLPFRRTADDVVLFDKTVAERLFRPRHGTIVTTQANKGPCLGVLGMSRIGEKPSVHSLNGREARRRALRSNRLESMADQVRKAVG